MIALQTTKLDEDLSYEKRTVRIMACEVKALHTRGITFFKVLWQNQQTEEVAWEWEDEMREKYGELFLDLFLIFWTIHELLSMFSRAIIVGMTSFWSI